MSHIIKDEKIKYIIIIIDSIKTLVISNYYNKNMKYYKYDIKALIYKI